MSFTLRRAAADTGLRRDLLQKDSLWQGRLEEKRGDHLHLLNWVTLVSRSLGSRASPKIVTVGIVSGEGGRDEWLKVGWTASTPAGFFSHPAEPEEEEPSRWTTSYYYTITFHQLKTLPPAVHLPKTRLRYLDGISRFFFHVSWEKMDPQIPPAELNTFEVVDWYLELPMRPNPKHSNPRPRRTHREAFLVGDSRFPFQKW